MSAQLRAELRDNLRSAPAFHETVERLWLLLTPEQVLSKLYAAPQPLAAAGDGTDLSGLHRDARGPWTVADAPLLDELAELLRPPPGTPVRASDSDIVDERAYYSSRRS